MGIFCKKEYIHFMFYWSLYYGVGAGVGGFLHVVRANLLAPDHHNHVNILGIRFVTVLAPFFVAVPIASAMPLIGEATNVLNTWNAEDAVFCAKFASGLSRISATFPICSFPFFRVVENRSSKLLDVVLSTSFITFAALPIEASKSFSPRSGLYVVAVIVVLI